MSGVGAGVGLGPTSSAGPLGPGPIVGEEAPFQLPAAGTSLAAPEAKDYANTKHGAPPTAAQLTALLDEMRHQELAVRLNAFRNLPHIAQAMGVNKTRKELIPYVTELVQNCDDDDEVLLLVAQTLGVMMDEVGGIDYAHELLAPLEQLTGADDPAVRAQTSDSIRKLCVVMSEANIEAHMVPLLQRLATGEWISSRISATSLFDCVYPRVRDARRKELRALYLALCKTEEVAAVKRAAAQHFGEFASVIDARDVKEELFPVLQKLVRDEQDSVRLLTIAACVSVAKIFGREANMKPLNVTKMPGVIKSFIQDMSWRVRHVAADKFCELAAALGGSMAQSDAMLDDFVRLLSDDEPEVRTAAAARVGEVARLAGGAQTIKKFLKPMGSGKQPGQSVLQAIVADTDEPTAFTRAALSGVLMSLCNVLKKEETTEYLLPLLLQMLKDKNSDVRLNLLSSFDNVPNLREVLPLDQINDHIMECIKGKPKPPGATTAEAEKDKAAKAAAASSAAAAASSTAAASPTSPTAATPAPAAAAAVSTEADPSLANNPKWRVRLQVIQLIPNLAKQLGEEFFDQRLSELCMEWLKDSVWSIREAATANLTKLAEGFGVEWAKRVIIPKVLQLGSNHSYLMRMTAVFAIADLAPILGRELTTEKMLPVLVQLATDPVPNVRFNSAKVLGTLMTKGFLVLPQPLVEHTLANLKQDADADVKYYADCSLTDINRAN